MGFCLVELRKFGNSKMSNIKDKELVCTTSISGSCSESKVTKYHQAKYHQVPPSQLMW